MSPPLPQPWPVIVVGAGASGLLAAMFAARLGRATLCLDARRQPGAKIRVSGGGRCNVLPSEASLADFETRGSSHALRNILLSWPRAQVQEFFEHDLGLPLVRESTGKLFPKSHQSRDVVAALLAGLTRSGATSRFGCKVVDIAHLPSGIFCLTLDSGELLYGEKVVVATGGLSMPKTGSDGGGWRMLQRLGHTVVPTAPALVPLCGSVLGNGELAGLSVEVRLTAMAGGRALGAATGDLLFTHRGVSGPAVLDISRHFTTAIALNERHALLRASAKDPTSAAGGPPIGQAVAVEPGPTPVTILAAFGAPAMAPDPAAAWRHVLATKGRASARARLLAQLPRRLAEALLGVAAAQSGHAEATHLLFAAPASELPKALRQALLTTLSALPLTLCGSEGYRTAEITTGGVPLAEVATRTLASRRVPGLFLCGEALDATGRLGGFNFLWAWVTGRRAGEAAAREAGAANAEAGQKPAAPAESAA